MFLAQKGLYSLFLCLQVHFLCFSIFHFRSSSYSILLLFSFWIHFPFASIFVYLTACWLFFMNRYCMQRRWNKTLKLPCLTPKSFNFYLIFISNKIVFFVSLFYFSATSYNIKNFNETLTMIYINFLVTSKLTYVSMMLLFACRHSAF